MGALHRRDFTSLPCSECSLARLEAYAGRTQLFGLRRCTASISTSCMFGTVCSRVLRRTPDVRQYLAWGAASPRLHFCFLRIVRSHVLRRTPGVRHYVAWAAASLRRQILTSSIYSLARFEMYAGRTPIFGLRRCIASSSSSDCSLARDEAYAGRTPTFGLGRCIASTSNQCILRTVRSHVLRRTPGVRQCPVSRAVLMRTLSVRKCSAGGGGPCIILVPASYIWSQCC